MRIMHLAENLSFGGLETQILSLCKEFQKLGHQPFIYAMVMSTEYEDQLKELNIQYMMDILPGDRLREFIRKNRIQVLHGHPAATVSHTAVLGHELHLPTVVTYHGLYGWNLQAHNNITGIVCVSREVYDKLAQVDPASIPKLTVIQNGIDTGIFKPARQTGNIRERAEVSPAAGIQQPGCPVILFIGRLDLDKYHALKIIIEALGSISPAELWVAGSGAYYDRLKSEAPPWVRCLGYIRDMPAVINQANIVIGTGRGIREAMACAKPVIALDACGYDGPVTPETIMAQEYRNFSGRSGRELNKETFLRDLQDIIRRPETVRKTGIWARKYAQEYYPATHAALKHLVLYNQLITPTE